MLTGLQSRRGLAGVVSRMLRQQGRGRTVQLRRGDTIVDVLGYRSTGTTDEAGGALDIVGTKLVVDAHGLRCAGFPGPVMRGDQVIDQGKTYTIEMVDERHVGDVTVSYIIEVEA